MLRTAGSPAGESNIKPHWDPKLRYNRKAYNPLVRRLHDIGYFNYTTQPECFVGVFFVWKSSRTKLRLITHARLANSRFLAAPGVTLMTSESFGRFEIEIAPEVLDDAEAQEALQVVLGLSDVKDCFHRLRVDRGPPVVIRLGACTSPRQYVYVYVDNLGVLGTERDLVEKAMSIWEAKFGELNLELHASEVSCGNVEALGCSVDCSKRRSSITKERLWKIRQALNGLLRRGRCTGRALEVVAGHLTFVGLVNRYVLSSLHTVYRFIRANYEVATRRWDTVVRELRCFKGILILLCQDWERPWNPVVSSSDSSLSGYGVCHATWPVDVVCEVGQWGDTPLEKVHFCRLALLAMRRGFGRQLECSLALAWRRLDGRSTTP